MAMANGTGAGPPKPPRSPRGEFLQSLGTWTPRLRSFGVDKYSNSKSSEGILVVRIVCSGEGEWSCWPVRVTPVNGGGQ
ncbi:hypothetical protein V6N13_017516 [Hibiscus sabdariffa]